MEGRCLGKEWMFHWYSLHCFTNIFIRISAEHRRHQWDHYCWMRGVKVGMMEHLQWYSKNLLQYLLINHYMNNYNLKWYSSQGTKVCQAVFLGGGGQIVSSMLIHSRWTDTGYQSFSVCLCIGWKIRFLSISQNFQGRKCKLIKSKLILFGRGRNNVNVY